MEHKKNYMVCEMKESLCEELTESSKQIKHSKMIEKRAHQSVV